MWAWSGAAWFTAPCFVVGTALMGALADRCFGEPRRFHPLIGFGRYAEALEKTLNPRSPRPASRAKSSADSSANLSANISGETTGKNAGTQTDLTGVAALLQRIRGILAWALAVIPVVLLSWGLMSLLPLWAQCLVHIALLWFALGGKSLTQHIAPIGEALARGDLASARKLASRVVSRDLSSADESDIARAAVESALENGNDAIFGALFWFFIAGGPGALAFRLINTLDAMWGYRTPRLRLFGCAAARIDDAANWFPARITAGVYLLLGEHAQAWSCWRTQAPLWDSPNAGPVMAAGAGALGVLLGGPARYHGVVEDRPALGCGAAPSARDIERALALVQRTTWCYLGIGTVLVWSVCLIRHAF